MPSAAWANGTSSSTPEALDALVNLANGDARAALNTLEFAAASVRPRDDGTRVVDERTIADALQRRATGYDKSGDAHYDTISAFIKTVRGSDPDAAVYWLDAHGRCRRGSDVHRAAVA